MPGEGTDVGRIVGYLILDRSDWRTGIEAARAEARSLGRESPTVRINVAGAAQAVAEMKAVDAAGRKASGKSGGMGLLLTSILAIGPALIPLAGVAVGALVGLGAAGGVAILGILGIRDAMKQGTAEGQRYKAAFAPVTGEFTKLKSIAAVGLFDGINSGIKTSRQLFPQLNRDTAAYSAQLGAIVGHVAPGLVALLGQMDPLFRTFGNDLVGGSAKFQKWASSSDSVRTFVAYVQNELPKAEQAIGSLIVTGSHIVQGFAPWGGTVLTSVRLLSAAINTIPIGALQTLIPLVVSGALAFKAWSAADAASTKLTGFSSRLAASGGVASKASGFIGGASKAVQGLGAVGVIASVGLGVLSTVMGRGKDAAVQETKRVNELTQAIEDGTAAIGVWNNAQETGAAKATEAGLSQKQIVTALMGTSAQYEAARQKLAAYQKVQDDVAYATAQHASISSQEVQGAIDAAAATSKATAALAKSREEYEKAKAAAAAFAAQQGDAALAAQVQSGAIDKVAAGMGLTASAYYSAKLAADKQTKSTETATAAMQVAGDTAGLLAAALAGLSGKALSVAQAETNWHQSITAATAALKTNGHTVADNTAKGQANQSAIQQMATSNEALVTAQLRGVKSSTQANAVIDRANGLFDRNAAKIYGAKSEAYKYATQIGHIPHIAATDVRFNDSAARRKARDLVAWVESLHPIMEVTAHTSVTSGHGKLASRDSGGPVVKGTPYIIGLNRRPEIFVPEQSGRIVPITPTASGSSGMQAVRGGAAAAPTLNVYPQRGQSEYEIGVVAAQQLGWMAATA